ncbi:MAG: radical SAM protein [bacterium]|nr:B12-binding domain-containing radical SAM protein [bacterium]MBU1917392.1 B12-binding domain-containing radical SAM protein [bacterium]
MNILFVNPNYNGMEYISQGIAYLSSRVKKDGHNTALLDFTFSRSLLDDKLIKQAIDFSPDIICISSTSSLFNSSLKIAAHLKKMIQVPVLLGGPQTTVAPENSISKDCIDIICIGEGEESLAAYANNPERTDIPGLWFKQGNAIIRNAAAPLFTNLDALPMPDFEIFDLDKYIRSRNFIIDIITSRGCPYSCTYCINQTYGKIYGPKWHKIRKNSVHYIISFIKSLKHKYPIIKTFDFKDDCFATDVAWLKEFSEVYPKEVGLPYIIHMRPELASEERCKLLNDSGCIAVKMGIESGSETIRKKILNRHMSNKDIINAFNNVKKAGMNTFSFNMIALPHEKPRDILKTLTLNRQIQPGLFSCNIFQPFEGTSIRTQCINDGLLEPTQETQNNIHTKSILKQKQLPQIIIRFFYIFSGLIVFFPKQPIKSFLWVIRTSTEFLHPILRKLLPKNIKSYLWKLLIYSSQLKSNKKSL